MKQNKLKQKTMLFHISNATKKETIQECQGTIMKSYAPLEQNKME